MRRDRPSSDHRVRASFTRRPRMAFCIVPILAGFRRADEMPAERIDPNGHTRDVQGVAFTPDGKSLVSVGLGTEARIWDVATGTVRFDLRGHRGDVFCAAV